jgi:hypothetical protein
LRIVGGYEFYPSIVSDVVDCADCSVFIADLTALREKHAFKCEELDVLRVELVKL